MSESKVGGGSACPSERLRLKRRRLLRGFWNSQPVYWETPTQGVSASSIARERVASIVPKASRIEGVACGGAADFVTLRERGDGDFGKNVSIAVLRHAQSPVPRLISGDANKLPCADPSFDAVTSTYPLEHAVNPVLMLQEMVCVVRSGGRIILRGPARDLPFWYPKALQTRARRSLWRLGYRAKSLFGQRAVMLGSPSLPMIIDEPYVFTQPFIHDSDAVDVIWTYKVIRQMRCSCCRLAHWAVGTPLLGNNHIVCSFKRTLTSFSAYKCAGSTAPLVFER
jgi:SAM-dependent methyltransferase